MQGPSTFAAVLRGPETSHSAIRSTCTKIYELDRVTENRDTAMNVLSRSLNPRSLYSSGKKDVKQIMTRAAVVDAHAKETKLQ